MEFAGSHLGMKVESPLDVTRRSEIIKGQKWSKIVEAYRLVGSTN